MISSFFAILCGKNPFYDQKSPKKPFNFSRVRYGGVTNDRLRGGKTSGLELTSPPKDFLSVFGHKMGFCDTKLQNMIK